MRKVIVSSFFAFTMLVSSLGASSLIGKKPVVDNDFNLIQNMRILHSELDELQNGFILYDKKTVLKALDKFATSADNLLSNEKQMIEMLPEDMKSKRHKVDLAVENARKIKYNVSVIKKTIANKDLSVVQAQKTAQGAYLNILNSCFQCHNLVRDKYRCK